MLVRGNAFLADRIDVVDGATETNGLHDRRGPGLELVRWIAIGDPVSRNLPDHLAAAIVGPHRHQVLVLGIEHADASRAVQFVAGKDVEIAVDIPDVDAQVNSALAAVHQYRDAPVMGELYD